jgi:hypothetical protein
MIALSFVAAPARSLLVPTAHSLLLTAFSFLTPES